MQLMRINRQEKLKIEIRKRGFGMTKNMSLKSISMEKIEKLEKEISEIEKQKQREMDYLLQLLSRYYIPGIRQNICIGLAGFLRREGYSLEEVIEFFQKFWNTVYDPKIFERIEGIKQIFKEPIQTIEGLNLLPKKMVEKITKKNSPFFFKWGWYRKENKLIEYVYDENKKKEIAITIGPWFNWIKKQCKNDKEEIELFFDGKWFKISHIGALQEIIKYTKINITNKRKYTQYLNTLNIIASKHYCLNYIGFKDNDLFFHPVISNSYYIWDKDLRNMAKSANPEKHLQVIKKYLQKEDIYKIGYSFVLGATLSCKFISPLFRGPLMLLLYGPENVDKTSLGILLSNMFLAPDKYISSYPTKTKLKLFSKKFKVPFLIDNIQSREKFEDIIFQMIWEQIETEVRKKKNKRLKLEDLENHAPSSIIFTLNSSEDWDVIWRGIYRKVIPLKITTSLDIDFEDKQIWGGGVLLVQYWLNNGQPEIEKNKYSKYVIKNEMNEIVHTLFLGATVLENYFSIPIVETIEKFFERFNKEALKRASAVDKFYQDFLTWILTNYSFFLKKGAKNQKFFGLIEDLEEKTKKRIYVPTKIFKKHFGKYYKYFGRTRFQYLFSALENSNEKIKIIKGKNSITKQKKIANVVTPCYCFEIKFPERFVVK